MIKTLIFISGKGTNMKAIIENSLNNVLPVEVLGVISNKIDAEGLKIAEQYGVNTYTVPYSVNIDREEYDRSVAYFVNETFPEVKLIVLAGWMHVFSNAFIKNIHCKLINLHPALPGKFPGKNAIEDAFKEYNLGKTNKTGIMVHNVIEEIDGGDVLDQIEIPIYETDTLDKLKARIQYFEKPLLLSAIMKLYNEYFTLVKKYELIYRGKVRDVYDIGYNCLAMVQSDRQSAFDKHICEIRGKGTILTASSKWWFENTRHIIPNHYLWSKDNVMIVRKCRPIKIEMVVRGYMTGNTSTSLWTHYNNGVRYYCGNELKNGIQKNERLSENIVTPTTKGVKDELITGKEIVDQGYMTRDEWYYLRDKSLELFNYGQIIAEQKGLILVDTKYEFGYTMDTNELILIDEIHTCDSSRYWLNETYDQCFISGMEPDKFDKDVVRDYIRQQCDPYNDILPEVPDGLIDRAYNAYASFYQILSGEMFDLESGLQDTLEYIVEQYFCNYHGSMVVILSGSEGDKEWVNKIISEMKKQNIYTMSYVASAHKQPDKVLKLIHNYNIMMDRKIVMVAVAGRSNALGGVLAANSKYPVINCPPLKDKLDQMTNLGSSIQNPSQVPSMLILEPSNCALAVRKIFDLKN